MEMSNEGTCAQVYCYAKVLDVELVHASPHTLTGTCIINDVLHLAPDAHSICVTEHVL